jgi:4-amino-4-deoxy-L-arabinose transferase-like glycosyltransferase
LVVVAALALAIRLVYALTVAADPEPLSDAWYFQHVANLIADGTGYVRPTDWLGAHVRTPTAEHPPLYPLVLAASSTLGATGLEGHRVVSCLIGTSTVPVVGLIGREVGGPRIGLVAAAIAAVYPLLWVIDGSLFSEGLWALTVAVGIWAAYRVYQRPRPGRVAFLGGAVGLAALTRGEGFLLLLVLAIPVVVTASPTTRESVRLVFVCIAVCLAVISPWVIRNWLAFDHFVPMTTSTGLHLAGANCDATYRGRDLGLWRFDCIPLAPRVNEVSDEARLTRVGLDYATEHAGRVPIVAAVRLLRAWDLYDPSGQARYEIDEGRNLWVERAGLALYYVLLLLAVAGAVVLRRRKVRLWPLLAPAVLLCAVAVTGYGVTRFRAAVEVSIIVLAAVAIDSAAARVGRRPGGTPLKLFAIPIRGK